MQGFRRSSLSRVGMMMPTGSEGRDLWIATHGRIAECLTAIVPGVTKQGEVTRDGIGKRARGRSRRDSRNACQKLRDVGHPRDVARQTSDGCKENIVGLASPPSGSPISGG